MSCHEGRPFSGFSRSFGVVRSLPVSFVGMSRTGFIRIGALLPALDLLVAFLATVPALRGGFPMPVHIALTPPISGGSGVTISITSVPPSLISLAASSNRTRAGTGASGMTKMCSCFCRASLLEASSPCFYPSFSCSSSSIFFSSSCVGCRGSQPSPSDTM